MTPPRGVRRGCPEEIIFALGVGKVVRRGRSSGRREGVQRQEPQEKHLIQEC